MINVNMILDVLIVILLLATIFFTATLSRRLRVLRDAEGDLARLMKEVSEAAAAAEASLSQIREWASSGSGQLNRHQLNRQIERGRQLIDELAILIRRADSLAERLGTVGASPTAVEPNIKTDGTPKPVSTGSGRSVRRPDGEPTAAERDLLEALRAVR